MFLFSYSLRIAKTGSTFYHVSHALCVGVGLEEDRPAVSDAGTQ